MNARVASALFAVLFLWAAAFSQDIPKVSRDGSATTQKHASMIREAVALCDREEYTSASPNIRRS